jgi:hypothetical protein
MFSYELMSDGKYHRVELLAVKTNFTLRVDGGLARYTHQAHQSIEVDFILISRFNLLNDQSGLLRFNNVTSSFSCSEF